MTVPVIEPVAMVHKVMKYQFSVTMKHGCSRIVTDFGETFLDCLF